MGRLRSRIKKVVRVTAKKTVEVYAIGVIVTISISLIAGAVVMQSVLRCFGRASMDPPS